MIHNRITSIAGLRVGHAEDRSLGSGVTALIFDAPVVAGVDVRGGGPGTRETDLLDPERTVERIDALVLSGGSAFGLDAAAGVMAALAEAGRGFAVGTARVPIVPAAVLFDLLNGGDKDWGRFPPYRDLGYAAAQSAAVDFALGSVGAGTGAATANLKGGIGSAFAEVPGLAARVGALAAVNAFGRVTVGDGAQFWAAPYEVGDEFGGLGFPRTLPPEAFDWPRKDAGPAGASTTLAVVATDAILTKAQARRLAVMAQDGLARAIHPVHTPLDGDVVFAVATGRVPLADPVGDLARLGDAAARTLARAIAIGVHRATSLPGFERMPSAWAECFGRMG
ncbi:peptidase T4 [Methylobacterium sp. Leaf469]|uniref:P1 family peptidase n=1 Tax=unclassified Methylobacterium TaxID=2615210 RepID=UPI0006F5CA21|nr:MULTISPECIES: P1 family peptidase [unclassified Methylobacterium]KQP30106.1 peptidase T4 [Methylobacterium sp. Leaf102]KQP68888.1 peptidase T4 [Methylobacterium sp. Leaf112]KQT95331.1 peptidase T4 [Methylobacterium sp. Leaf469]USU31707.1 P1 family peptidase [Methylobacterium sp. OTU13CASTA1]